MVNKCIYCGKIFQFSSDAMEELEDSNYPLYWESYCSYQCAKNSGFIDQYQGLISEFYDSLDEKQKKIFKILFEEGRLSTDENYFIGYILSKIHKEFK